MSVKVFECDTLLVLFTLAKIISLGIRLFSRKICMFTIAISCSQEHIIGCKSRLMKQVRSQVHFHVCSVLQRATVTRVRSAQVKKLQTQCKYEPSVILQ